MSEIKKKLSGAAFEKNAKEKREEYENVIKKTKNIVTFFSKLSNEDSDVTHIANDTDNEPSECETPTCSKQLNDVSLIQTMSPPPLSPPMPLSSPPPDPSDVENIHVMQNKLITVNRSVDIDICSPLFLFLRNINKMHICTKGANEMLCLQLSNALIRH